LLVVDADAVDIYAANHVADYGVQTERNKQFMILCLSHFNPVTKQVELPA